LRWGGLHGNRPATSDMVETLRAMLKRFGM
jgi:hypothetical protein